MACFNTDTQSPIAPARGEVWFRPGKHAGKGDQVLSSVGVSLKAQQGHK